VVESGRPPPKRCPRPQVLHFSGHDLSNLHVKSRPVRDSHTAQTAIFAPTMRHGEGKFLVCSPPVDGAMCTEGASACGKRCQLAFHCPETPHTPHTRALSCRLDAVLPARLPPTQMNRDRAHGRLCPATTCCRIIWWTCLRPRDRVSFLTCCLPAGPRSGSTVLRLQPRDMCSNGAEPALLQLWESLTRRAGMTRTLFY
jgi:hypothetical protein